MKKGEDCVIDYNILANYCPNYTSIINKLQKNQKELIKKTEHIYSNDKEIFFTSDVVFNGNQISHHILGQKILRDTFSFSNTGKISPPENKACGADNFWECDNEFIDIVFSGLVWGYIKITLNSGYNWRWCSGLMEVVIPASFGYYGDGTLHNYLTRNRGSGMNKPEMSDSYAYTDGCFAISNVWADTTNKKHRITIYNKGGARNMVDIEVVTTGNHEFSIEMGKVYKIPFGKTIGGKTDKDRYGPYNGVIDIWGFGEIPTNPGPQINPKSHRRLIEDNLGMINTLVKKTTIINRNISAIQDSDNTVENVSS